MSINPTFSLSVCKNNKEKVSFKCAGRPEPSQ